MVGPEVHCPRLTTNLGVDGESGATEWPFPDSRACANVASDTTVWVSCEGDLTKPASLWLSEGLSGAWTAWLYNFLINQSIYCNVNHLLDLVAPDWSRERTGNWWNWNPTGESVLIPSYLLSTYCKGLIWRCPNTTCFSVAINRPIKGMNCLSRSLAPWVCILCVRVCCLSWLGLTRPWEQIYYPTQFSARNFPFEGA